MNNDSADASAARRISLKRSREAPRAAAPVLIDLLSDDDGDLVVGADARAPTLAHRALAVGDRRAPLAADYNSEDEDDEDDEDEMEDSEDSDDPDDNGSDLDGFIVSDSDEDEDDGTSDDGGASEKKKKSAATDDQDSEAEFVPRDDLDDDPDDDDDTVSSHTTHRDTSSSSPIVTIGSDDDDDGQDDDDKPHRDGAAAAAEAGDDGDEARPSKRARLDDAEVSSVDPGNIVSGKRCRRTTERYMDRHFMEFMVRDVPPSQIAAVFDDEDEYFQSGVSLTDSSDDDDDDDGDGDGDGGSRDLDSSDYEDMDALSSSRARRRRRSDAAPALPVRALASPTGSASVDLSRPPSTVAALLRSLAAQPGGIRPSVASPRSAPTSRVRPPP